MREIKFRAWDGEDMYLSDNIGDDFDFVVNSNSILLTVNEPFHECGSGVAKEYWQYVKRDAEIMQFTGLKDKDGVEIYEGDILRYVNKSRVETLTREVIFTDGMFLVEESDDCGHQVSGICSDENHKGSHVGFVIGNIYENPELLELTNE